MPNGIGIPIVDGILNIIKGGQERGLKEAEIKAELERSLLQHDKDVVAAVNATMQAEAKSEHWAQWLWRPTVGFTYAAVIINNYILMPYFQNALKPIVIPSEVWSGMMIILGAAAAFRGWQKVEQTKANGNGKIAAPPSVSEVDRLYEKMKRENREALDRLGDRE